MRGKLVSMIFASWMLALCLAQPGVANPLDSSEPQLATPPVAVQRITTRVPEGAAMLLIGTLLMGLAAAVRRAV